MTRRGWRRIGALFVLVTFAGSVFVLVSFARWLVGA